MADFTIGVGGDFLTLEAAATDPSNINGNRGLLIDALYTPNTNVAAFAPLYELIPQQSKCDVDTSKIASGICLQGGEWGKVSFRRYNNTAAIVIQNASINECSTYTPLQDGAVVGCTGDLNAVTTLNGDATGLTGTDNKFVVNVSGVPGAYEDAIPGLYHDGLSNYVDCGVDTSVAVETMTIRATPCSANAMSYFAIGTGRGRLYRNSSSQLVVGDTMNTGYVHNNADVKTIGLEYNLDVVNKLSVEGVTVWSGTAPGAVGSEPVPRLRIGARWLGGSVGLFFCGVISYFQSKDRSYFMAGDFGSATLIDHSGNGNDGTINGSTWVLSQEDPLTPKIGGSLLITSGPNAGKYAGSSQPVGRLPGKVRPSISIRVGI